MPAATREPSKVVFSGNQKLIQIVTLCLLFSFREKRLYINSYYLSQKNVSLSSSPRVSCLRDFQRAILGHPSLSFSSRPVLRCESIVGSSRSQNNKTYMVQTCAVERLKWQKTLF